MVKVVRITLKSYQKIFSFVENLEQDTLNKTSLDVLKMNIETVSRAFKLLEEEGYIKYIGDGIYRKTERFSKNENSS